MLSCKFDDDGFLRGFRFSAPESSEKQPVMFLTVKGLFFSPLFSFLLFYLFLILASGQMLKINKRELRWSGRTHEENRGR